MTKNPTLKQEKKLWRKGYKWVVGVDEAGRGPLAGPVVAAAVMIKISNFRFPIFNKFPISNFPARLASQGEAGRQFSKRIKDSKKLTSKKREEFYKILTNHPAIEWGIGRVSEKVIDKINILEATKLAMKKAVKNLNKKLIKEIKIAKNFARKLSHISDGRQKNVIIDYLVLDGNFRIDLNIPQKSIIKADEKVFSCAAASIIAKVWRDRIMKRYHKKYPNYGFDRHKGYPTKLHYQKIAKFGICKIHRKTFRLS